ncbi:MAG TPA: heavy-metal-associated domain-containing protein [Gaiellaceae bacterium]|nr:heavy-metal-associated domain-containing protein [Gaiellaceae bacterium]
MEISFVVEEAGCDSCAALVRAALEPLGEVRSLEIDEAADRATVRLVPTRPLEEAEIAAALAAASEGTGHAYRVQP